MVILSTFSEKKIIYKETTTCSPEAESLTLLFIVPDAMPLDTRFVIGTRLNW
jgi:hypothetical protein